MPDRTIASWRIVVWGCAAALLLAATIANRTVAGFNWTPRDFLGAALVLGAVCLAYEITTRKAASSAFRAATCLALLGGFVVVWANFAVGIIGTEDNPANLMFLAPLALGAAAAFAVRFRPAGMAETLALLAAVYAALGLWLALWVAPMPGGLIFLVAAIWSAAALLYKRTAGPAQPCIT